MMNDAQRNSAFYHALEEVVTSRSVVLDIGAGSGLLSMMAARLGASSVLAVEQSSDIVALTQTVIQDNQLAASLGGPVKVFHGMSSDLELSDEAVGQHARKATIVVSELVGTLLLGEMQLEFLEDARAHLLAPGGTIIPAGGVQYVTLIQSYDLDNLTSVESWQVHLQQALVALLISCIPTSARACENIAYALHPGMRRRYIEIDRRHIALCDGIG